MKKKFIIISSSLLFIILIISGTIYIKSKDYYKNDAKYLNKLFNKKSVVDIKITIDDENSKKLYSDVSKEKYVHADITINGETYKDVGIRTKGNYIYTVSNPINNPEYKWAYKVKFNKYNKNQTFHGLTEVALNTNFADPTFMKEVLNYGFFEDAGLNMPYYTFGNVTLNNTDFGLVTFVEFYNTPYMERYYNTIEGNLYKPNNEYDEAGDSGPSYKNAELMFIDYNLENYSGIFEKTVTDDITDKQDKIRLISILEELKKGSYEHFDVNSYIQYLAVANSISLLDTYSYSGKNFYLFESENYLRFIPYDLNLSYVNYVDEEGNSITFDYSLKNFKMNMNECYRPLTCIVANNSKYYKLYENALMKFLKKNIDNKKVYKLIDKYDKLIKSYIPNKNYDFNYEEYKNSLIYLKMYFKERNNYIKATLKGNEYSLNKDFIEKYVTNFKEELYKGRNKNE